MLEPLRQWICDTCGEIIQSAEQGYVEWMETNDKMHGFRIVHHARHSPRKGIGGDCYYGIVERGGDGYLTDFVGARGLLELTSGLMLGNGTIQSTPGLRFVTCVSGLHSSVAYTCRITKRHVIAHRNCAMNWTAVQTRIAFIFRIRSSASSRSTNRARMKEGEAAVRRMERQGAGCDLSGRCSL
jgi:hypothetical protein